MNSRIAIGLVLLAVLLGAAFVVFYGPDVASMATIAALLAIPAGLGALISHVTDPDGELSPLGCFLWPTVGIIATVAALYAAIGEGAICIAMILPLWLPAAAAGALVQHVNRRRRVARESDPSIFRVAGWLAMPLVLLGVERQFPMQWENRSVSRSVEIGAAPDIIWPMLVTIANVRPNEGRWNLSQDLFGVPRPEGAMLVNEAGQLVRKAAWQQGARFEERITAIEPGRRICWNFAFPDASLQAVTDRHISPDGPFLKIERGCYTIEPLAGGRSRVTLVTTYRMRVQLAGYFALWGERFLGDIQANVLGIVADRAEARRGTEQVRRVYP